MNAIHSRLLMGFTLALSMTATLGVASAQSSSPTTISSSTATQTPVYKPPLLGAPATRVGGASRGAADSELILSVLAPEGTGLTRRAQPTLYWYITKSLSAPLEFTLNDDHSVKPLVEIKVTAAQPGIHALRLNYSLKPEVEYQWSLAAVADPDQRASDTLASGTIKQDQPSAQLAAQLKQASLQEQPFLYAQEGFWYDAIATLSEQIDAYPADHRLREQRSALLEQVGLKTAAAYDRAVKP
jgi:hypothetical protein